MSEIVRLAARGLGLALRVVLAATAPLPQQPVRPATITHYHGGRRRAPRHAKTARR